MPESLPNFAKEGSGVRVLHQEQIEATNAASMRIHLAISHWEQRRSIDLFHTCWIEFGTTPYAITEIIISMSNMSPLSLYETF